MYYKIEYLKNGKTKYAIIKANSPQEAIFKFRRRKLGIFRNIEEFHKPSLKDKLDDLLAFKKINLEEYVSVLEQMYVMLNAGLAVDMVLENIAQYIKDRKLRKIIISIANDVKAGISLTEAVSRYEKELGILSVALFRLGEETGDLAEAIKDLALIQSEILENRRLLKKATRYPTFVIVAMMIAFTIVILFVIPPFKNVFEQTDMELPLPTKILLLIDKTIREYGALVIGGGFLFFIVILYLYEKNEKIRFELDKFLLRVYIIGEVVKLASIGRFVYVFERLLAAGISVVDAFDIAIAIVDNSYLKLQMLKIRNSVITGGGIAEGFEETKLFEPMIVQMIRSGEEAGALIEMLGKVSNYYLTKYRDIVSNISTLIEPILIMAIAGFVLMLALGIFLPMWDMTKLAGR